MATAEASPRIHDNHTPGRRRHFSSFMKRLTGLKHNSSGFQQGNDNTSKLRRQWKNNPYPESSLPNRALRQGRVSTLASRDSESFISYEDATSTRNGRVLSMRSAAPTVATNAETVHSDAGHSKAPTSHTVGGTLSYRDGGGNSTFSSPQQSQESITTTFTTLQSTAPSGMLGPQHALAQTAPANGVGTATPTQANPGQNNNTLNQHHVTYHQAIANNILTDNASILTLASSTKRRRRRSLDTDASIRAIAPSSLFGNSRESLPLSVLSANFETASAIFPVASRPGVNLASAERASVYSSSGIAPIITSERNSYYAGKQVGADGASVRSGLLGHGKTDSISGSITGMGYAQSPLTSPREASLHGGRSSRRSSDWQEIDGADWGKEEGVEEEDEEKTPEKGNMLQESEQSKALDCSHKESSADNSKVTKQPEKKN